MFSMRFVHISHDDKLLKTLARHIHTSGGGQSDGNPGEQGREVGGKREETERDAGVM